jgi:hypothetical protein
LPAHCITLVAVCELLYRLSGAAVLDYQVKSFRTALADWQDPDIAMFYLAVALGLIDDSEPWGGRKDLFWTNNPVGNLLHAQLRQFTDLGALDFDEAEGRFRWNPNYELP